MKLPVASFQFPVSEIYEGFQSEIQDSEMQDFKKLSVWQKARILALSVYQATRVFPKEEVFGLTSQMQRACISIAANIAEGCGRDKDTEFSRFLQIAMGSAYELECHLILAHDLNFLNNSDFESLNNQVNEVRKMLIALNERLKNK